MAAKPSSPSLSWRFRPGGHSALMIEMAGTSPAMTKSEPPRVLPLLPCVVTSAAAAVQPP